jgi:hypothetical protein
MKKRMRKTGKIRKKKGDSEKGKRKRVIKRVKTTQNGRNKGS